MILLNISIILSCNQLWTTFNCWNNKYFVCQLEDSWIFTYHLESIVMCRDWFLPFWRVAKVFIHTNLRSNANFWTEAFQQWNKFGCDRIILPLHWWDHTDCCSKNSNLFLCTIFSLRNYKIENGALQSFSFGIHNPLWIRNL